MKTGQTQEQIKQFDIKEQQKLLKALGNMLNLADEPITEAEALSKDFLAVMDPANVSMIEAKSIRAKLILKQFIDKNRNEFINPKLDYTQEAGLKSSSKISLEYLSRALKIFDPIDEAIEVSIKNDYPITLQNEDFRIVIAPRMRYD